MVWSRALFQSFTLRTYLDSVVGGGSADTVYRMMRPRVYAQCYVAYLLLTYHPRVVCYHGTMDESWHRPGEATLCVLWKRNACNNKSCN